MDQTVDLLAIAKPLPRVRFPNGTEHQAVAFDAIAYRLLGEAEKLTDPLERAHRGLELLQRCYPSAQLDDFASLGMEDATQLLTIAKRQIDLTIALGNGSGVVQTVSDSPDSSPPTTSSTSASGSGESPAEVSSTA